MDCSDRRRVGLEFNLSLGLKPSVVDPDAVVRYRGSVEYAAPLEPPAYATAASGGPVGVLTIGRHGMVSGTVFTETAGVLSIARDEAGDIYVTEAEEQPTVCGAHAELVLGEDGFTRIAAARTVKAPAWTGARHRRANRDYEPWWGLGSCYTDDSTLRAVKIAAAVTKRLHDNRFGGSVGTALEMTASQFNEANLIFEAQLNMQLHISHVGCSAFACPAR